MTGIALLLELIEPGGGARFEVAVTSSVRRGADQFLVRQNDRIRRAHSRNWGVASGLGGRAVMPGGEEPQVSQRPFHTPTRTCGPAEPFRLECWGDSEESATNQSQPIAEFGRFCGRLRPNR